MQLRVALVQVLLILSVVGCATGKSIDSVEDIRDDGEENIVLLTYDLSVYVTQKHSSVKQTMLSFLCPSSNDSFFSSTCFSVNLPYKGGKDVDGYNLEAFESAGAIALKMEYGNYSLESASHSVVIERVPETKCSYDKKEKKEKCRTYMKDDSEKFKVDLPERPFIRVSQGSGCYIGHLNLVMVDREVRAYSLDKELPLSGDRLANLSGPVVDELLRVVDRPCS